MYLTQAVLALLVALICHPAFSKDDCGNLIAGVPTNIVISEKAMKHIWQGELGQNPTNKRSWIKGGLHSFPAMESFLSQRPDIYRLGERMVDLRKSSDFVGDWYNLNINPENGVGTLRLPRSAFSANALMSLYQADIHASGGFLWKTLFPRDMSEEELKQNIIDLYEGATSFEDRGHSILIEGTVVRTNGQSYRMKIVVGKKQGQLISAYPSFSQSKGIQGPTPIQRALQIVDLAPSVKVNQDIESFSRAMNKFLRLEFISRSWWGKDNFSQWNALPRNARVQIMDLLMIEGLHVNGSLSMVEQVAVMTLKDYQPESFVKKSLEVIRAVIQDPDFSNGDKLIYLLSLISNQRVYGSRPVEDVIIGKFLLAESYKLISKADIGMQQYAVRMIEKSPLYFLNLIPFEKGMGKSDNPFINFGQVADAMAVGLNIWRDEEVYPLENNNWYFEYVKDIGDLEWQYFRILEQIEDLSPGFVTGNLLRIKYFSDFINVMSFRLRVAEITERWGDYQIDILGARLSSRQVIVSGRKSRTLRQFSRHRSAISRLLFQNPGKYHEWYKLVNTISSGSSERLKVFAQKYRYEVTNEGYQIVENPIATDGSWYVPHVEVHVLMKSKKGPVLVHPMLANYVMSMQLN